MAQKINDVTDTFSDFSKQFPCLKMAVEHAIDFIRPMSVGQTFTREDFEVYLEKTLLYDKGINWHTDPKNSDHADFSSVYILQGVALIFLEDHDDCHGTICAINYNKVAGTYTKTEHFEAVVQHIMPQI